MSNATTKNATPRCPRCKGKGEIRDDNDRDAILSCPDCDGTGEDADREMLGDDADYFETGRIGNK